MAGTPVTFFIDRCLTGFRFRYALRRAKVTVESLEDHFPPDVQDVDWIPIVSAPPFEWVIVTKDNSILANPHEFAAICDFQARVVMFPDQDLTAQEMSVRFLHFLPDIQGTLDTRSVPWILVLEAAAIQVYP